MTTIITVVTEDDFAVGDAVSAQLEKMWGWYLAGGILSVIFGFFVISYRHASVYAIVYLASGFFIAVGIFEIVGAIQVARERWLHLVFGVIWVGIGIVGFVWPHITIFIVAVLIGWAFLVLGIFDIIESAMTPRALLVVVPHPGHPRRGDRLPLHPAPGRRGDGAGRARRHPRRPLWGGRDHRPRSRLATPPSTGRPTRRSSAEARRGRRRALEPRRAGRAARPVGLD